MDLVCPRCHELLKTVPSLGGHAYVCPTCHGQAATIALFRRAGLRNVIQELWQSATQEPHGSDLGCPSCRQNMARISYSSAQGLYELELCQTCQILWFDRSEVDQFGASFYSETSDTDFKQKSRHAKDRLNIESLGHRQIAFENRPTTDTWSLLVGVLGLPREINPTPTASKSLATWSLIIIISLVTLTTYFNPQAREFLAAISQSHRCSYFLCATQRGSNSPGGRQIFERFATKSFFNITRAARRWLVAVGYDPAYGARPLGRTIQEHIKRRLADEMLFGKLVEGGLVTVDLDKVPASDSEPVDTSAKIVFRL